MNSNIFLSAVSSAGVAPVTSNQRPKLLDQVRIALRSRHYSRRTETAYINWIRRFILFHDKRHPAEMAEAEVKPVPHAVGGQ